MTVVNTAIPVISDTTPMQGQTISTSNGSWTFDEDYLSYAYQWERCDTLGANCVDISGATGSAYSVSAADVGSTLRSRVTATEHTNPPGGGTLRSQFTDFYSTWGWSSSDHNGQIFQNRWHTTNLQTLQSTQTPWSSTGGAAIYEVNDHLGRPGFRFLCNPEMLASSGGKKVEITEFYGNPYGAPMVRGNGFTDEIYFYVRFPSSGNPSGFPGNTNAWDVFWQHDTGTISGFGIDMEAGQNPPHFYCGLLSTNSGSRRADVPWNVEFDKDYRFHFLVTWSTSSSGSWQWWIQRETDVSEIQYMNYTGQTQQSNNPNTEFGFYATPQYNTEVIISDIRVTNH